MNNRVTAVFRIARIEYVRWLTNPRNILLFVMIIFTKTMALDPLFEKAEKFGSKIGILEPFAAVGNSTLLIMFLPAVYLVLMSDFPKFDGGSMFYISRVGKREWLFGQILFAVMSTLTYILSMFVFIAVFSLSNAELSLSWSDCTRYYIAKFPNEATSFAVRLLPSNLYNQIELVPAVLHTFFLLFLNLLLLSLILMTFKISSMKTAGLFANLTVIALGFVTCITNTKIMWWFPMANSIIWFHYTEILRDPIMPVWFSYAYFAVIIILLIIAAMLVVKKSNFITEADDG